MIKTIIFDIDGTLANLDHRLHFVTDKKKNWAEFLARVKDDLPIEQTIFLNGLLSVCSEFDIVLSSGRSENERKDTEEWMARYGVQYDHLYMRPAGDYRADHIVKKEMLDQMRADGREPWLVFDDRQSVVDMWRKEGLFVLQCAPKESMHDVFQFHEHIDFPLNILVGPSGAGKTTFVDSHPDLKHMLLSSDVIREQICGDFRDQSHNLRVFEAFHSLALERLRHGLPVVLDATHIRTADRLKSARIVPVSVPVQYIVIDRPLEAKLKTAGWRASVSVKGKELVRYHHEVMQANIKAILNGDGLPNVTVLDMRKK